MKPIPFLAALVPALAVAALIAALKNGFAWYGAAALFYASLALAELGYLAALFIMNGAPAVQDRRAKTGGVE